MDHIYRRLLRFRTSQGVPSTRQFAQGVPESMTVHRTLRELQALHATAARLDGRDVAGAGAGEDIVVWWRMNEERLGGNVWLPNLTMYGIIVVLGGMITCQWLKTQQDGSRSLSTRFSVQSPLHLLQWCRD